MIHQHPLIPLIFCVILLVIIIKQCFIKHRFLKLKALLAALLSFVVIIILVFYNDMGKENSWLEVLKIEYVDWILLVVDAFIAILLYTTVDASYSNEKFQQELTRSMDESKYFVILDKKDRVKGMSKLFLQDLEVDLSSVYKKNFFDVIEYKYRIKGFNETECYKDDIKKFYEHYDKKVNKDMHNSIEITIQSESLEEDIFHFVESLIFSKDRYKGRILIGDKKNEENLIEIEKNLSKTSNELLVIKNRFVTILEKTVEGIFFNDITQGFIWCNDILVKKLSLNGNSMSNKDFYRLIHPEDLPLYEEKMKSLPENYSISYRFNTGSSYVYVKEEGHKITIGKNIELCGIMTPIDNYRFSKTDTILDTILGEPEMLARIATLEREDKIFEIVYFRVASIPQINEQCGRAIGNTVLSQYVGFVKQSFVTDNQIYRVSGLDFVALVTDYRKMDILKTNLMNGEKILHAHAEYVNQKVETEVFMGIARSDDHPSHKNTLNNAKEALRFCTNPQFNSNYAFYKDIK